MVRYTLTPLVVTFTVSPSVLPITKSEAVKITLLLASLIFARLAKLISSTVGTIASPVYIFLKERVGKKKLLGLACILCGIVVSNF